MLLCKTLKCERVDDLFLAFLHTRSGGNPFFAKEMAEDLNMNNALSLEGGTLNVGTEDAALDALSHIPFNVEVRVYIIFSVAKYVHWEMKIFTL